MTHGAGIVCVPMASSVGRYDDFYTSLERLQFPAVVAGAANAKGIIKNAAPYAMVTTRNYACQAVIDDPQRAWLWFMDDDHTFDPGLLIRLLDRDVDVVVPLIATRLAPYQTVLFKDHMGGRYGWDELPITGLFPLPVGHLIGGAGVLVRRHVLQRLEPPWFRVGQYESDAVKEDFYFADSLHRAGVTIHVDCDETLGHIQVFDIQPRRDARGQWRPALVESGDRHPALKAAVFA